MLIPRSEPLSYIYLINEKCLIFMENKYHMLCSECYKGHFKYPREYLAIPRFSTNGRVKKGNSVFHILLDNLKSLRFYET